MARRAAPPNSGPAYITPAPPRRPNVDPNESGFSRFMREQLFAPEKLPGNISIGVGVGMFLGGIAAIRTWGEFLVFA